MLSKSIFQPQTDPGKSASSPSSRLAFGLIIALSVVNLLLVWQNFSFRQQLLGYGNNSDATARSLKAGDTVSSIAGTDIEGRPYQVQYKKDGRRQLLLFFSPNCGYCKKQAPLWRSLLNEIDSNRFSVVGVVGEREDKRAVSDELETLGYLRTKTPLPVVVFSEQSLASYRLVAAPTTLLIDDTGRVEHSWVGMWDELKAREVASALK